MINKGIILKIDWLTVFIYLLLVLFGWVNIYSSVYNEEHKSIFDISQRYGKQLLWIIIAFAIIIFIFLTDSYIISSLSYFIYGITILMLILVFFLGEATHGSHSWFKIGDFKIQPAEFAKFALALAVSKYMNKENFELMDLRNFATVTAFILLPFLLILLQGDAGSALVFIVFILVLYREGLPFMFLFILFLTIIFFILPFKFELYGIFLFFTAISILFFLLISKKYKETLKIFLIFIGINLIGIAVLLFNVAEIPFHLIISVSTIIASIIAIFYSLKKRINSALIIAVILISSVFYVYSVDFLFDKLGSHQQKRILVFLDIIQDTKEAGYNINQSKIAIGSGGLTGKGFLKGTQTKYNFVPEQETDYIYCTVGEEWGFVGSVSVILIFTLLIFRIVFLAEKQRSTFGRIYGYSTAAILFFHYGINIAMTINLAPSIGIPLPFFSYGGSSLIAFTILLFIFLKIDTSRNEIL